MALALLIVAMGGSTHSTGIYAAEPAATASEDPETTPTARPAASALIPDVRPTAVAPRDRAQIAAAIERGVGFLLADQNPDGSWGSAERTKDLNIYAPAPGAHQAFRAAVTALVVLALVEAEQDSQPVQSGVERAQNWLLEHLPTLRRGSPDALYNVWGHGYGVQALAQLYALRAGDAALRERIRQVMVGQIELLDRFASVDGGWGYYDLRARTRRPASDSTSFMNAAVLVALKRAKEIGVDPPQRMVARAIASTQRQRKPDGSFLYGEYLKWRPMDPINRPGGSLGRSQACNVALREWNDATISDEVIVRWLDQLFARDLWLDLGRKRPVPHSSFFAVAGYFYYFGHYYAALAIDVLPAAERDRHFDQLATRLLPLQEKDGSWWDYPLYNYHQQYGTAFALLSLARCR